MMHVEDKRSVGTLRVNPEQAVRLLPSIIVAWNGRPMPPPALGALIAGTAGLGDGRSSTYETTLTVALNAVGQEYADGFVDGFGCATAKRKAGRRYVEGLDDGSETRLLLRKRPWGRMLIEESTNE